MIPNWIYLWVCVVVVIFYCWIIFNFIKDIVRCTNWHNLWSLSFNSIDFVVWHINLSIIFKKQKQNDKVCYSMLYCPKIWNIFSTFLLPFKCYYYRSLLLPFYSLIFFFHFFHCFRSFNSLIRHIQYTIHIKFSDHQQKLLWFILFILFCDKIWHCNNENENFIDTRKIDRFCFNKIKHNIMRSFLFKTNSIDENNIHVLYLMFIVLKWRWQ